MNSKHSQMKKWVLATLALSLVGIFAWIISVLIPIVVWPGMVDAHAMQFLIGGCYFPDYATGNLIAPTEWQFQQEITTHASMEDVKQYYENALDPKPEHYAFRDDGRIWQTSELDKNNASSYLFSCYLRHDNQRTGETACIYVHQDSTTNIKLNWQFTPMDWPPMDCSTWLMNHD